MAGQVAPLGQYTLFSFNAIPNIRNLRILLQYSKSFLKSSDNVGMLGALATSALSLSDTDESCAKEQNVVQMIKLL